MGIMNQFLDVIEYEDASNKIIIYKWLRPDSNNNELKQGSEVIVREGQSAAFVKQGKLADIMCPGKYKLNTDNFPILSTLGAFPSFFKSSLISDVYFINTRQIVDNKWATKNPIMKRDADFGMVRIRAFGKYSFKIVDVSTFMREFFGSKGIVTTYDIVNYLSSTLIEAFAEVISTTEKPVIEIASQTRSIADSVKTVAQEKVNSLGVQFTDIIIESISLPEEVEKIIDEQSGIGVAKQDMGSFVQYQSARAMRDAAKQDGGLAGLGAGFALGNNMVNNIEKASEKSDGTSKADKLRELKSLLDDGILSQEEFDAEKKKILQS